jgi:uncharacterized protein
MSMHASPEAAQISPKGSRPTCPKRWADPDLTQTAVMRSQTRAPRPFAAIVKPTDRCNLRCRYCYVTHRAPAAAMTAEVLEAVISAVATFGRKRGCAHFIWHGGEPLLMGRTFFEKVLALQRRHCSGLSLDNCVQTNGTLITPELVKLFVQTGFAISLSLDGPSAVHDANRCDARGHGSHARVMRAIETLRDAGQLVGAVAVLTRRSAPRIRQIYRFMKRAGVQYRMNPVIAPDSR